MTKVLDEVSLLKAKLECQNKLWAGILHDLRSPLSVINLTTQVLSNESVRPERRQRNLKLLQDAVESLNQLCQDVLDYSRLQSGAMELCSLDFHLRDCLHNIVGGLSLVAERKGIQLHLSIDPAVPARVVGDPGRLRQILMNLLSNAIKFTHRGQVELCVERNLRFSVRDSGIGMSPQQLEGIFEPYKQAHAAISGQFGGSGLGLNIARHLVQKMGGELQATSELGKGSEFFFQVDLPAAGAADSAALDNLTGLRVLVVDEDETNRGTLEGHLLEFGMIPTLSDSGPEAISLFEEAVRNGKPFPVVVVDLSAGGGDGFFLIEQIHPDRRAESHILVTTSQGQRGDAARCLELGVEAYLPQPYERQELQQLMRLLVSQHSPGQLLTRHTLRERGGSRGDAR